jgi:hypothetical protein
MILHRHCLDGTVKCVCEREMILEGLRAFDKRAPNFDRLLPGPQEPYEAATVELYCGGCNIAKWNLNRTQVLEVQQVGT